MKQKKFFFQDWGTFPPTTLVSVNYKNYKELISALKKDKKDSEWVKALEVKLKMEGGEGITNPHCSRWDNVTTKRTYSLLFLPDWKNDVKHYMILAHEILHGISFLLSDFLDPMRENEAFCYQHSYLFERIVKKICQKKN